MEIIPVFLLFAFFIVIGVAVFGLWVWSLIHCINNKRLTDTNRIIGIVLIVVLGIIGSIVYYFMAEGSGNPAQHMPPQA